MLISDHVLGAPNMISDKEKTNNECGDLPCPSGSPEPTNEGGDAFFRTPIFESNLEDDEETLQAKQYFRTLCNEIGNLMESPNHLVYIDFFNVRSGKERRIPLPEPGNIQRHVEDFGGLPRRTRTIINKTVRARDEQATKKLYDWLQPRWDFENRRLTGKQDDAINSDSYEIE